MGWECGPCKCYKIVGSAISEPHLFTYVKCDSPNPLSFSTSETVLTNQVKLICAVEGTIVTSGATFSPCDSACICYGSGPCNCTSASSDCELNAGRCTSVSLSDGSPAATFKYIVPNDGSGNLNIYQTQSLNSSSLPTITVCAVIGSVELVSGGPIDISVLGVGCDTTAECFE